MKKVRIVLSIFICIVFIGFVISGCNSQKTMDYTWPKGLLNIMKQSAETQIQNLDGSELLMYEKIVINEDGSITLTCTDEQRIRHIEHINLFLNKIYEWANEYGMSLWISEDKLEIEIIANPDTTDVMQFSILHVSAVSQCYLYRLFTNVPEEELFVTFTIINELTGNIVAVHRFPDGSGFDLNPEDWN